MGPDDLSSTPIRPKSVPCVRPDCTCSVFSTKLRIIVHNFTHQPFDQLVTDQAILTA